MASVPCAGGLRRSPMLSPTGTRLAHGACAESSTVGAACLPMPGATGRAAAAAKKAAQHKPAAKRAVPIEETFLLRRRSNAATSASKFGQQIGFLSASAPQLLLAQPSPSDGAAPTTQLPPWVPLASTAKERGWVEFGAGRSVWSSQARTWARDHLAAHPAGASEGRDASLRLRLAIADHLEREGVEQGIEALRVALRLRAGSVERAVVCLEGVSAGRVGCASVGISLLELAGGLTLMGLDAPSLCGCSERELARRLSLTVSAFSSRRMPLDRLLREARGVFETQPLALATFHGSSMSISCDVPPRRFSGTSNDGDATACEAGGAKAGTLLEDKHLDRWVAIAKFVVLTSWFHTPPSLRRRGRGVSGEEVEDTTALNFPFRGGAGERSLLAEVRRSLRLDTVEQGMSSRELSGKTFPQDDEIFSLSHAEVELDAYRRRVIGFEAFPEPPNNIPAELLAAVNTLKTSKVGIGWRTVGCTAGHPGFAQQEGLDDVRSMWAPSEEDLVRAEAAMVVEFDAHASARQLGRHLLGRSDLFQFVGESPPADLLVTGAPTHWSRRLACREVGEVYDDVLELQVLQTAPGKAALTKGLTFEYFRLALLRIALRAGLHFAHIVDDAVDSLDPRVREKAAVSSPNEGIRNRKTVFGNGAKDADSDGRKSSPNILSVRQIKRH
eukprot:TRINITY_DN27158_c0_g1_i1.p1 TRINITY_DN27158_c0_g1~~TRINITY_DN27158_c0_g1_i1.p1  ORF type:complete len:672 (+),score=98.37 TRINITY_DN27158_c0_g1_i1:96-2111(+)